MHVPDRYMGLCLLRFCNHLGHCCFATGEPMLWNSLPEQLQQPDITVRQFTQSLKRLCLVRRAVELWDFVSLVCRLEIFILTYLLTNRQDFDWQDRDCITSHS